LVLALVLSACGGSSPPRSTSTPSSTESARLAAAIDAFTVFNATLDGYAGGSKTVDDFEPLVTSDYFEVLVREDAVRDTSTRTVGASSFSDEKLVDPDDWGGYGDVSLVVCRDISRTEVVDASGAPSRSTPIRTLIPMIVYFVMERSAAHGLLITKVDQWKEDGYCS
jgi:hypothetical protein